MRAARSQQEERAPRFRAYLNGRMGALVMGRDDWNSLIQCKKSPMLIDVSATPMASISKDARIVGTFAERTEDGESLITIMREDPKDAPRPINVDRYSVLDDVPAQIDYHRLVVESSTSDDPELRDFLADYVLIVPAEKGAGHHLVEVPAVYRAMLE